MPTFTTKVAIDAITLGLARPFEYAFTGVRTFQGWAKPAVPESFGIGLLIGPSGSGKSLLLREFGKEENPKWGPGRSVASHFKDSEDALKRLTGVGLNSVPAWCSDYSVLSTGEKFRADLARKLKNGAVIDEFTSVVDRNVAKAASCALRRFVSENGISGLVLASCHEDIIPWLQPDWYFTTVDGKLHDGRLLRRPEITLRLYPCKREIWPVFQQHHYFNKELSKSSHCWIATADLESS